MSQLRSSSSLELEIQALLKHYGELDLAADALIKRYEHEKLSLSEFETIATFLLLCGFCVTLTDLVLRKLSDRSKVPWAHFVEALFLSTTEVDADIKRALVNGAEEDKALSVLSRTHCLDHYDEELNLQRKQRQRQFQERHRARRQEMFHELEVLKSQGLHAEEEKLIASMQKFFPGDLEISKLSGSLKERLAVDFFSKRVRPPRTVFIPRHEPKGAETLELLSQIEKAWLSILSQESSLKTSLAQDFAVAMMTWEAYESALRFLDQTPAGDFISDWLRAEILLEGGLFAELLNQVSYLESVYAGEPDHLYAVQYLRAQALWGLNQRITALEILEGIVNVRPQYRTAAALLDEWKEDFL